MTFLPLVVLVAQRYCSRYRYEASRTPHQRSINVKVSESRLDRLRACTLHIDDESCLELARHLTTYIRIIRRYIWIYRTPNALFAIPEEPNTYRYWGTISNTEYCCTEYIGHDELTVWNYQYHICGTTDDAKCGTASQSRSRLPLPSCLVWRHAERWVVCCVALPRSRGSATRGNTPRLPPTSQDGLE